MSRVWIIFLIFFVQYASSSSCRHNPKTSGLKDADQPLETSDQADLGYIRLWNFEESLDVVDDYETSVFFSKEPKYIQELKIATLDNGAIFKILDNSFDQPIEDENGDLYKFDSAPKFWVKVNYRGNIGYLAQRYVLKVNRESYQNIPTYDNKGQYLCGKGNAITGLARNRLEVFQTPDTLSNVIYELPIGHAVKVIAPETNQDWIEIEYPIFEKDILSKGRGFVLRELVGIRVDCRLWPLDKVIDTANNYSLYSRDTYSSFSPSYRQINLSLTMSAVQESTVASGSNFDYCSAIQYNLNLNKQKDIDRDGCKPGEIYNKQISKTQGPGCDRYVAGHGTTPGTIVPWGGACGTGTQLFRAAYKAGFPILRHHNHYIFYTGSYSEDTYGFGGRGTDAEIYCDSSIPEYSFAFANDSKGDLIFVTGSQKKAGAKNFETYVWIYGNAEPGRQISLSNVIQEIPPSGKEPVKIYDESKTPCKLNPRYTSEGYYTWPRTVLYQIEPNMSIQSLSGSFAQTFKYEQDPTSHEWMLNQTLKPSHYFKVESDGQKTDDEIISILNGTMKPKPKFPLTPDVRTLLNNCLPKGKRVM